MSLIEQALRRLQDPMLPRVSEAPPTAQEPAPSREPRPTASQPRLAELPVGRGEEQPAHSWPVTSSAPRDASGTPSTMILTLLVGLVLIMTVALLVGGAWWLGRMAPHPAPQPSVVVLPSLQTSPLTAPGDPRASGERTPRAPLPGVKPRRRALASRQPPALLLSGVVEGTGEPYAVINGAIVGVGDQVGGFRLVAIADGTARLLRLDGGEELVLRVPR